DGLACQLTNIGQRQVTDAVEQADLQGVDRGRAVSVVDVLVQLDLHQPVERRRDNGGVVTCFDGDFGTEDLQVGNFAGQVPLVAGGTDRADAEHCRVEEPTSRCKVDLLE